jgi:hypothetical protein
MIKTIVSFFIFCLTLFLYLHIRFHQKVSNDLEVYEVDNTYKNKIEEVCNLRQPVLFDLNNENLIQTISKQYLIKNYPAFNINIRKLNEMNDQDDLYAPLSFSLANKLFEEDKERNYISENNSEFLNETGCIKNYQYNDEFLRPNFTSNCNYDILCGSENSCTPFKYELNFRNYFIVSQGSVKIKLSPPKSSKYLYTIYDYENFEFRSPINPFYVKDEFLNDFEKIKCLEINLFPGKCLYIPAYWWYSIKFDKNSSVNTFKYRTYMNNITILPNIFLSMLQNQNIIRNYFNKVKGDGDDTQTNTTSFI